MVAATESQERAIDRLRERIVRRAFADLRRPDAEPIRASDIAGSRYEFATFRVDRAWEAGAVLVYATVRERAVDSLRYRFPASYCYWIGRNGGTRELFGRWSEGRRVGLSAYSDGR